MAPITLLVAALIAPLAFAMPKPGNTYGSGGSAPAGWNAEVEKLCSAPTVLVCCDGPNVGGVAGEPDSTSTGCTGAMAGGQITYEFGYCPYGYAPRCCAVVAADGIDTGCGIPTQVYEPTS
ncbi:MAG: hypothetical protein Q9161_009305 [Pseudevernia consocians]